MMSTDAYDRDTLRLPAGAIGRRRFLGAGARAAGAFALAGPLLLEGCGDGNRGEGDDPSVVRISNWPLYIGPETTSDFERATGIRAAYTEDVNDNNEYFAKIAFPLERGQSIDRDVVVLSDWLVAELIRLEYCAPLRDAEFPNKARLVDRLADVAFDPGRRYSMPWLSGMVGLAYNPEKTGREITRVGDIFDPAFAGQVTMLLEMRDTLGLLMLADGRDPAAATRTDVEAACARIETYRKSGHIRAFTGNDYTEDLASGNIAVAMAWSGDVQGLAADNPDLRFVVPDEGGMLFSDCMFIPRTSDRVDAAMAWMNYVYDPVVSARIVSATMYWSPVQGVEEELARIAPELARSPLVNPPAELLSRLHSFRVLDDEENRDFNRIFQRAIGA